MAGGAAAALLAALAALLLLGRKRGPRAGAAMPLEEEASSEPPPPAEPLIPSPSFRSIEIAVDFAPQRLMMTLVNARLSYELSITNRGTAPVGLVAVNADLIGAHASLSKAEQLMFEGGELQKQFASLNISESVSFAGELVLPLAAIPPISNGQERFAALLARFNIRAIDAAGVSQSRTVVFLVGEEAEGADQPLRLLRLDHGPRTLRSVGRREIAPMA